MSDNSKPTVFLIDDDKFLLDMYSVKFKASGFNVRTATGPNDALTKLKEGEIPSVIILDIIMPNMDGLELLGQIRKEKLAENVPIVMLTNESDPSKIEQAKSLGVQGYIVKATSIPSEVVEKVSNILKKDK